MVSVLYSFFNPIAMMGFLVLYNNLRPFLRKGKFKGIVTLI